MTGIDTSAISGISAFAGIPDAELSELLGIADEIEIGAGERLFAEDEPADAFYVILSGGVDLSCRTPRAEARLLGHSGTGAALGETSLLVDGLHSASARATEPTRLLRFATTRFKEMLDASSMPAFRLVLNLARTLAARLRAANDKLAELASNPATPAAEDDLDRLRKIFFADWGL